MNGRLLNVDEVASYLGVHRDTVYSLIRGGKLPAMQLGGRKAGWRISQEDLTAFVDQNKSVPLPDSVKDEMASFDEQQAEELRTFRDAQRTQRDMFFANKTNRAGENGDARA